MNQGKIWCDFRAEFCHKFNSGKSTWFKWISQGFLQDGYGEVRNSYPDQKIHAAIKL